MALLTPAQLEVLREAAAGRTMSEIAAAQGRSPSTVKDHLDRARVRLRARNVTHAVAIALRRGVIE